MSETAMPQYPILTWQELDQLMKQLSKVYDVVRIVDVGLMRVLAYDTDGSRHVTKRRCHDVWNKEGRCKNCISAIAFREKNRLSKFEFIDHDVFHVTSQYIVVDGDPCLLEIVEKDSDMAVMGAFGKNRFVNTLQSYTDSIYIDSLTKVFNRKYFDEQLAALDMDAVAMIDVDNFKIINDTYGHVCGDKVLHMTAQIIKSNVRAEDSVVRYGGDEFFLAFSIMDCGCFYQRLEKIRTAVEQAVMSDFDGIHVSISIGGVCGRGQVSAVMPIADQALYKSKEVKNSVTVTEI